MHGFHLDALANDLHNGVPLDDDEVVKRFQSYIEILLIWLDFRYLRPNYSKTLLT